MEKLILVIIGWILGKYKDSIVFVVKFSLSCATSYLILNMLHPNLYLWSPDEYENPANYKLFYHSGLLWPSIGLAAFWFGLFYLLMPYLLSKLIDKKLKNIHTKKISSLPPVHLRLIFIVTNRIFKPLFRIPFLLQLIRPKKKVTGDELMTYNEFSEYIFDSIAITLHSILCWIFIPRLHIFPFYFTLLFIVLLFSIIIFFIPIYDIFKTKINDMLNEEYNKHVK